MSWRRTILVLEYSNVLSENSGRGCQHRQLSMDRNITNVVQEDKASLVAKYQCYDYDIQEGDYTACIKCICRA